LINHARLINCARSLRLIEVLCAYGAIAVLLLLLLPAGRLVPSSRECFATGLGAYWSVEDCISAAQKAQAVT
jgi:hypothetical protein